MNVINPNDYPQGLMFSDEIQKQVRERFCNMDSDSYGERVFFENSGGALRLKACAESVAVDTHPDCPGRHQKQADIQGAYVENGYRDLRTIFGTEKGSIITMPPRRCSTSSAPLWRESPERTW